MNNLLPYCGLVDPPDLPVYWTKLQVNSYLNVIDSSIYKVEFHLNVQKVEIKCLILQEIKSVT